jgi:hypothetical protein
VQRAIGLRADVGVQLGVTTGGPEDDAAQVGTDVETLHDGPARPDERERDRRLDHPLREARKGRHQALSERRGHLVLVQRLVEPEDAGDDHEVGRPVHVRPGRIRATTAGRASPTRRCSSRTSASRPCSSATTPACISDNGRRLADLLDGLIEAWPVPVQDLILIGHPMGGLVARSALHRAGGTDEARPWTRLVRDTITLSTPHLGAPGNAELTPSPTRWPA